MTNKEGFKYSREKGKSIEDTFTSKYKRDPNDYKSITFFLEKEKHTKFKIYCAENNTNMTDVLSEYINGLLK